MAGPVAGRPCHWQWPPPPAGCGVAFLPSSSPPMYAPALKSWASLPSEVAHGAVSFWRGIEGKRHIFAIVIFLNLIVGATLSLTQFTQSAMAKGEFGQTSYVSSTAFLVSFGITKAFANLFVGIVSDKLGRRGCMILGWFLGLWLPVMQLAATNWATIAASNLWLGLAQGLTWSCCIFVLLDISGPENRAFAVGISETAGYTAQALFNLAAAALMDDTKKVYRPGAQWLVLALMLLGLMASFLLPETSAAKTSAAKLGAPATAEEAERGSKAVIVWPSGRRDKVSLSMAVFSYASVMRGALFAVAVAGCITNTLTGLDWGLVQQWYKLPSGTQATCIASSAVSLCLTKDQVANAALTYGITKGALQFLSGFLSDRMGRKLHVTSGMAIQALGLLILVLTGIYSERGADQTYSLLLWGSFTLGLGTGTLYPVLLACISDWADNEWRASALGSYRFWRDLGFAIGGIIAAGIADSYGISVAFGVIIAVCCLSAAQFAWYYDNPSDKYITLPEAEGLKLAEVAAANP